MSVEALSALTLAVALVAVALAVVIIIRLADPGRHTRTTKETRKL